MSMIQLLTETEAGAGAGQCCVVRFSIMEGREGTAMGRRKKGEGGQGRGGLDTYCVLCMYIRLEKLGTRKDLHTLSEWGLEREMG